MKRMACYKSRRAAAEAINWLEKQNIPAGLDAERFEDRRRIYVVSVDEHEVETALQQLRSLDSRQRLRCPDCGSGHIGYPNRPESSALAAAVEMIAESLHVTERKFFCFSCNYEWSNLGDHRRQLLVGMPQAHR